jgi:hypothetical protein
VLVGRLRSTVAGDEIAVGSAADRCLLSGVMQTLLRRERTLGRQKRREKPRLAEQAFREPPIMHQN